MEELWRIQLFGTVQAVRGVRVVSHFRRSSDRALLAYLAYHPGRWHRREVLIELLWPEREPKRGSNALSKSLSELRKRIEVDGIPAGTVIQADADAVQLNPSSCTTDVRQFEAALRDADRSGSLTAQVQRLEEAVQAYPGELLPGFFDDWVLQERQWLAELYFVALSQLLALLEAAGDFDRALEYGRRGIRTDPLREEAHRDLIRLLAAAGQQEAALRQYQELKRLLKQELNAIPGPETEALVRAIRSQIASVRDAGIVLPDQPAGPSPGPGSPLASNLPEPLSRFFGRHQEMARLLQMLQGEKNGPRPARLVTLTGAGGIGKTRLALVVAHRMREGWRRAVCWVPLIDLAPSAATDEARAATCRRIAEKILAGLGVSLAPTTDPLEQAVAALARQPTVLLLDNLEHLLPAAASLVQTLLERVEHLTVMATSRRQLGLVGERLFPVPPLPVPVVSSRAKGAGGSRASEKGFATGIRQLQANPSLRLFVDRAQAVKPDFQLTERNVMVLAELCRQLEGLPLAIELAGARAALLTPEQMLGKLESIHPLRGYPPSGAGAPRGGVGPGRFELLARSGWRGDPKQRSLRAALDWSHQLLTPELQRCFARLSVFRGGWTLAAARALCQEPRALEYLDGLRESSLILAEEDGPVMRYRLLETLREYGAEKLHEAGESETTRDGHLGHFTQVAEAVEPEVRGRERARALGQLEREHDNLRAALDWAVEVGASPRGRAQLAAGLRLAGALGHFWSLRGYLIEGRERLARLLALPAVDAADRHGAGGGQAVGRESGGLRSPRERALAAARAKALSAAGWLAQVCGDNTSASDLFTQCLAIHRELGMKREAACTLRELAKVNGRLGDRDAERALLEEYLLLQRRWGDRAAIAEALLHLGLADLAYDRARSRRLLEESVALREELGDRVRLASSLRYLGSWFHVEAPEAARALYARSLALCREAEHLDGIAYSLLQLGRFAGNHGDLEAARTDFEEMLSTWHRLGDRSGVVWALLLLGWVAREKGDYEQARRRLCEGLSLQQGLGSDKHTAPLVYSLGRVALGEGDLAQARGHFVEAVAVRRQREGEPLLARLREQLARDSLYSSSLSETSRLEWERARELVGLFAEPGDAPMLGWRAACRRVALLFGAAALGEPAAAAGCPLPRRPPLEQAAYEQHLAKVREALGKEAFLACWERGRTLTPDQIWWHLMWDERW